ncbi:unnamed protein product [Oreochromis niloticus]|nr:unnamed protein product [Mustela putorius furo]
MLKAVVGPQAQQAKLIRKAGPDGDGAAGDGVEGAGGDAAGDSVVAAGGDAAGDSVVAAGGDAASCRMVPDPPAETEGWIGPSDPPAEAECWMGPSDPPAETDKTSRHNVLWQTQSLNITRVNRNKTCTCTATNYLGNITKTIHLHVEPRGCPLTVNPSEIVVRFGDPVSVNCSTSARYVTGMGWEAPFGGTGFERPPVVTWRVDKLEEWTPSPFCYATLDDGSQCTLRPVITIFKTPDFVSISVLDHSLIMQDTEYNNSTRTQYWLQCNIINVAPVQFLTVNWYKNNESIMAMSFNDTTTKTPVNESSILKINISREENVAEFRCEAELDFGPHGPKLYVSSQTHNVSAHYAPEKNTKKSTQDIFLVEGTNITLSCEAVGNPPPVYNWTCDGKNMLENTNSLNITRVKHNATCTCTATNYLGNITHTINVHVKKRGCPLTLTPSETVVTFGDPVSVNCSTSATDVEGMGWEAPFGGTGFEPPPVVTWRVEKLEEWTPSPFCYATLVDGSQCTVSPVITVYKIPDTVSIYPMNQSQMMEKHVHYNKHTRTLRGLQCNIINVAPVQFLTVNWYKNNESIITMSFNDTTTETPVNESSILKVNISREENVAEFRCEAELDFGPHGPKLYISSQTHNVSAHYAPELKTQNSCYYTYALEGTNITLSCEAIGNPPPVYNWTCDGENMLENTNSLNITRVNRNKTCTCTATNYLGNITKTIHLHVEPRGCPLTVNPSEIVVRFGDPVSVNCSTSARYVTGMGWEAPFGGTGFEPPPVVTWRVDKLEEWTPSPFCYATLDDGSQCTLRPVITIFKTPDFVSISVLDHSLIMQDTEYNNSTRTQYWLQCNIINVAPVQFLTVNWYKNNESIMAMSFNDTTTKTPVNESSILKINISREENVAEFRCEAELDFGPHGPKLYVSSQTHNVSAHYAPEKNTKKSTQDIFLLEGTNITLSCEAVGNPPPVYNWTCDGKNMLENTNSLNITRVKHNATCTCTATNYLGNITHTINVHVKKRGCPLTLTPSETVVTFGDPVSVNCSTSATDVEGMGWEAPFGGTGFEPPPVVTWRVEKLEEWTPSPFCYVTLVDGSQCTVSPVITVYKIPDTVSIYPMNQSQMMEKHVHYNKHTRTLRGLQCNIINVAPVQFLTVNWYKNNESIMAMSFNDTTTKTPVNESLILKVNISREENVAEFRCEAELDFGPHGPKLYVSSQTHNVSAHCCPLTVNPSEIVVRFGDPVSVNCSTSARYVTGMGWEAPFGGTGFKPPPVVTWRVDKLEEWTPSPFCYATLADGSRCTAYPVIIVYKTPDFVSVPDMARGPMVEGIGYNLKCDIYNVAPVQNLIVKWYRGNETVLTQTFNGSALTPVNTSSTLRISTQRDYNGLIFRCEAELHLGPKGPKFPPNVTSPPYTAVVLYKPLMKACPDHVTVVENAAFSIDMLPCQPDGSPPPTVQWFYEEKLINASKSLTRTDSGKYTAVVENSLGRSNTSVHITVEHSPSFTCKEHYEVTVNDKPQSICEPVGLPTPTLTWFKDGKQMVSPQRWKKNDSGKYLLNAHNTHGTAEHTLYLEILYAPEFKGGNESKEVLQGEDVTISCSADSNPPSNIRWIYTAAVNSNVTTEGHQKIISITKATSTNGGYYICVAENKAGRNTRFVRLVIKGKTIKIPLPIIWVLLALLSIGLIVLVVHCRNQRKKRGHYNFVPDEMAQTSL